MTQIFCRAPLYICLFAKKKKKQKKRDKKRKIHAHVHQNMRIAHAPSRRHIAFPWRKKKKENQWNLRRHCLLLSLSSSMLSLSSSSMLSLSSLPFVVVVVVCPRLHNRLFRVFVWNQFPLVLPLSARALFPPPTYQDSIMVQHLIIHRPTSSGVSERANEWACWSARANVGARRSAQANEWAVRVDFIPIGPICIAITRNVSIPCLWIFRARIPHVNCVKFCYLLLCIKSVTVSIASACHLRQCLSASITTQCAHESITSVARIHQLRQFINCVNSSNASVGQIMCVNASVIPAPCLLSVVFDFLIILQNSTSIFSALQNTIFRYLLVSATKMYGISMENLRSRKLVSKYLLVNNRKSR